jgi:hypothetical protein
MTEDSDYQQFTTPGGQVFSMLTPEARRRQERTDIEEERTYERGLLEDQRDYDDRVRQDSQFFQEQMAELNNNFSRDTQIILSRLNQSNQRELLSARHAIESGLLQNPEQRYLALQNSYANMLTRFIDENGDFNHAGAASVANIFGQFVGMTGPEFMNMVVGNLEDDDDVPPATTGLVDRSALERARSFVVAEKTAEQLIEDRMAYLAELQAELATTTNKNARTILQRDINRVRGDLRRMEGGERVLDGPRLPRLR